LWVIGYGKPQENENEEIVITRFMERMKTHSRVAMLDESAQEKERVDG